MTSQAQPGRKRAEAASRVAPRWVPWAALGLLVIVLGFLALEKASPGPLASVRPGRLWALLTRRTPPRASGPLSLNIVHSNDTWGYVLPCG